MTRRVVDVSRLDTHAFADRDPLWWGVMLLVAIESTMLVLVAVGYFYVRARTHPFPPVVVPKTIAWIGAAEVGVWLLSVVPTHLSGRAAVAGNLRGMRGWLVASMLLGAVAVALRWYEIHLLPMRWDQHAYGSMVWAMLGLQWVHGLTGVGEDLLYVVLLFKGPVEDKHRVDVQVSTPLWYFVVAGAVLTWMVVYLEVLLQ